MAPAVFGREPSLIPKADRSLFLPVPPQNSVSHAFHRKLLELATGLPSSRGWRERKTYNLLRKTWSGLLSSLGLVWWVYPIAPTTERLKPENHELQEQGRQHKETKMCDTSGCTLECIPHTPRREEIKGLPWLHSELEASLGYMRLRLKTTTQTNRKISSVLRTPFCTSLDAVFQSTGTLHTNRNPTLDWATQPPILPPPCSYTYRPLP